MANTTSTSTSLSAATELEPLRAKSGWMIALGVVYVIAGLVALGSVEFATVATVFVVGIMMLVAGAAEVINAFQIKSWGKFLLWLLLGVLYIVAGFVTFAYSLLAAAFLNFSAGILPDRLGNYANCPRVQHEARDPMAMGGILRRDHPSARPRDSLTGRFSSLYILGLFLGVDLPRLRG